MLLYGRHEQNTEVSVFTQQARAPVVDCCCEDRGTFTSLNAMGAGMAFPVQMRSNQGCCQKDTLSGLLYGGLFLLSVRKLSYSPLACGDMGMGSARTKSFSLLFLTERDTLDASGCPRVLNQSTIHQSQRLHDAELVGRPAHHSEVRERSATCDNRSLGAPAPPPTLVSSWCRTPVQKKVVPLPFVLLRSSLRLAAVTMTARLSGVQREVHQLYRLLLRAAKLKDGEGRGGTTTALVRAEFREQVCKTPPHHRTAALRDRVMLDVRLGTRDM